MRKKEKDFKAPVIESADTELFPVPQTSMGTEGYKKDAPKGAGSVTKTEGGQQLLTVMPKGSGLTIKASDRYKQVKEMLMKNLSEFKPEGELPKPLYSGVIVRFLADDLVASFSGHSQNNTFVMPCIITQQAPGVGGQMQRAMFFPHNSTNRIDADKTPLFSAWYSKAISTLMPKLTSDLASTVFKIVAEAARQAGAGKLDVHIRTLASIAKTLWPSLQPGIAATSSKDMLTNYNIEDLEEQFLLLISSAALFDSLDSQRKTVVKATPQERNLAADLVEIAAMYLYTNKQASQKMVVEKLVMNLTNMMTSATESLGRIAIRSWHDIVGLPRVMDALHDCQAHQDAAGLQALLTTYGNGNSCIESASNFRASTRSKISSTHHTSRHNFLIYKVFENLNSSTGSGSFTHLDLNPNNVRAIVENVMYEVTAKTASDELREALSDPIAVWAAWLRLCEGLSVYMFKVAVGTVEERVLRATMDRLQKDVDKMVFYDPLMAGIEKTVATVDENKVEVIQAFYQEVYAYLLGVRCLRSTNTLFAAEFHPFINDVMRNDDRKVDCINNTHDFSRAYESYLELIMFAEHVIEESSKLGEYYSSTKPHIVQQMKALYQLNKESLMERAEIGVESAGFFLQHHNVRRMSDTVIHREVLEESDFLSPKVSEIEFLNTQYERRNLENSGIAIINDSGTGFSASKYYTNSEARAECNARYGSQYTEGGYAVHLTQMAEREGDSSAFGELNLGMSWYWGRIDEANIRSMFMRKPAEQHYPAALYRIFRVKKWSEMLNDLMRNNGFTRHAAQALMHRFGTVHLAYDLPEILGSDFAWEGTDGSLLRYVFGLHDEVDQLLEETYWVPRDSDSLIMIQKDNRYKESYSNSFPTLSPKEKYFYDFIHYERYPSCLVVEKESFVNAVLPTQVGMASSITTRNNLIKPDESGVSNLGIS